MAYQPRVLLLDYEVSPWGSWNYGPKYEPRVIAIREYQFLMSVSYCWLHEGKVKVKSLPDFQGYSKDKTNDAKLATFVRDLINEADVMVAYNGKNFDFKQLASRLLFHRIDQHKPVKLHDPLLVARSKLYLPSNSLEDLAAWANLPRKGHTQDETHLKAMFGDKKAWKDLNDYCKQDGMVLLAVYKLLRGLATGPQHPNMALFTGNNYACPHCNSEDIHKKHNAELLLSGKARIRYMCNECGKWFSIYESHDDAGDPSPIRVRN